MLRTSRHGRTPVIPLLFIIFLEGYVVLSTELLAIRLMLPFTGSGTDTVSIIIAAILMPLAFGYHAGGRHASNASTRIRARLVGNLLTAALFLSLGLSYVVLDELFSIVAGLGIVSSRIVLTAAYCLAFLVWPVYLLGQTVPLVSAYFSRERLPAVAGRILFVSTLGSFMGAIFCTLVLMSFAGVHHAATVTVGCIALLVFMLARRKASPATICAGAILFAAMALNSGPAMRSLKIVENNKYNTIQVVSSDDGRIRAMRLNRSLASAVYGDSREAVFPYVAFIERNFLTPLMLEGKKSSILVLGAGGFTMGRSDPVNDYLFVDIDAGVKDAAESHLLQEKLPPNKKFVAMEARAFLNANPGKYDLIILDLFRDPVSTPEYLVTREFYRQVRDHLAEGGVLVGNYFASPFFRDEYSVRLDNTLRSVFPNLNRQPVSAFNTWGESEKDWTNIIYSAIRDDKASPGVYTDDLNRAALDMPGGLPGRR